MRFGTDRAALTERVAFRAAYDHISEHLGWSYAPGEALPMEAIARTLGVSRQPVRDAVRRLAEEGLVTVVPQVASVVVRPEPREIADLARLVAVADGTFAPIAATRALPSDVAELEACFAEIDEVTRDPDRPIRAYAVARLGIASYFRIVYGLASDATLGRSIAQLRLRMQTLARLSFFEAHRHRSPDAVRAELGGHKDETLDVLRSLLAAIADRDSERAGLVARAYSLGIAERIDGDAHAALCASSNDAARERESLRAIAGSPARR